MKKVFLFLVQRKRQLFQFFKKVFFSGKLKKSFLAPWSVTFRVETFLVEMCHETVFTSTHKTNFYFFLWNMTTPKGQFNKD